MVRKGFPILEKGLLAPIIFSVFISCFIILLCTNVIAQATDDYLEDRNGFENDNYRNAAAISPGEYNDLICRDDDWYKVIVPDSGEIITANLKVSIQFSHMIGDLDLVLYSTKATPNDYNFLEISGLTANEEIVSASVPPGDYLIKVYSYQGVYNNYTMNIEILYPCQYVPYEWIDITNGEKYIDLGDDDYQEIEIGFDFKFYDQIYKKVKVSSNGYLTFAERTLPYFNPNSPIPIRANHRNAPPISIFSYWMDLCPDLGGGIFYKPDDQSNPNCKKLIVEWRDVPKATDGAGITFQAVLFECSNQILLQYKDVIFTSQNDGYSLGSGATIGITNGRKTKNSIDRISTQYLYKDQGVTEQTSIMFTPSLNDPLRILSSNLIGEEIQDLSPNKQLKILFSQYIDINTLDGSLLIDPYVNGEWLINKNRIVFDHPDDPFETSLSYTVTLLTDKIRNCFEKPLSINGDYIFTFMFNETDINRPLIEVSPESHTFDDVFVNEASNPLDIFIFNRGNADLDIKGIILSDETNFSLNLNGGPDPVGNLPATISSGESRTITIVFTPFSKNEFDASLNINSNDPNTPSIFIPLYGRGVLQPEPDIRVSPTSLNFENTRTGKSSTLDINIFNKGKTVLNISGLNFQNQNLPNFPFVLTGDMIPTENSLLAIPENESRNIPITFTPPIEDMFNTTIEIISDDPDTPKIYVSIKGRGLSMPIYDCLEPYDCLANTNVTVLMIDTNENIWIGTKDGGVCEYNLYNGTFTCFNEDNGLAGNNVADIAMGPDGEIWVATNPDDYGNSAGVSRFIATLETFISYDPAQMGTSYGDIEISDIVVDDNGHLWVAADSELLEFDGSSWKKYGPIGSFITCLDVDSNGRLWIGTDFLGIYVKEPFINLPRSVDITSGIIDNISNIVIDVNGNLWITSRLDNKNSLLFLSPESLISLDQDGLTPESFPLPDSLKTNNDTVINDLFIHPITGSLFIATDNGFFMHDGDGWHHFDITNSYLPSPYINSIIVDEYNDYWIGTEEGLSHFNSAAPYIVGEIYGDKDNEYKTDDLPINTNIFVFFSEPMNRISTKASFQMINKENGKKVNGTFYWNKNSTVIKFEPEPSLAYNSNYEVSISKEAKDRAGMTIDMSFCGETDYCPYVITTESVPEKAEPSTNPYTQYTGLFNYRSNYNYNSSYWSGYSVNNFKSPYWLGHSIGNSLLKIPSDNFNIQYNFDRYSNYQSIRIPQAQSFPFPNFSTWNQFSTSTYNSFASYNSYNNYYTKDMNQTFGYPLQGLNNYTKLYQSR
ncbi:MAG: choice-of-anchor D domain-containing protein [bacterium]